MRGSGDYISREAAIANSHEYNLGGSYGNTERAVPVDAINSILAADVPSALWTDKPISGTEFMTHNQGQSGFEIHFRTDDRAKYEAVQDECRRQIDHAKPAADVRPVVKAKIVDMRYTEDDGEWKCSHCGWQFTLCVCGKDVTRKIHYCPNCGADMREES